MESGSWRAMQICWLQYRRTRSDAQQGRWSPTLIANVMRNKRSLSVLLLTTQGRIGRRIFWLAFLPIYVSPVVLFILAMQFSPFELWIPFFLILILTTSVPAFCLVSKRLHDQGHSMWFVLINAVPILGHLLFLGALLEKGHEFENQYGKPGSGEGFA